MRYVYTLFSKHLQWLDMKDAAVAARDAGFDGIDLTVRPGGHVEPESVEKDLPEAVEAIESVGLVCPMMVTSIVSADDPATEPVLKTASECGIGWYRMGYYSYDFGRELAPQLAEFRAGTGRLAELNERYSIHGAYQNHAGNRLGGPVLDIERILRGLDSRWIGCQYDIRHAVIEGGTSWEIGMRLLSRYIRCVVMKDGKWTEGINDTSGDRRGGANGRPPANGQAPADEVTPNRFKPISTAVGQGMVDWAAYLSILREIGFDGPVSVHYEYGLPGEDGEPIGKTQRIGRTVEVMKRDLDELRRFESRYVTGDVRGLK